MKRILLPSAFCVPLLLWLAPTTRAQTLSYSLDRSGTPSVRYTIRIDQSNGKGSFHDELPVLVGADARTGAPAEDALITVDPELLKKLFATVPTVRAGRCETHMKKISQTGTKVLRYESGGAVAQCSFNYSDDERLNTANSLFEAIADTMQYGERLSNKLRFDRLGLDVEMDNLTGELSSGRAVEVVNIAPVLQAIQNDERVMERVRRKAAHLLESAGITPASQGPVGDSSDR